MAALGSIAFAVIFCLPILRHLTYGDIPQYTMNDWDFSMELQWVALHSVTFFHQFPLWDPYKCGGMPALGNPQSGAFTPFFFLEVLFGPMAGIRLSIPFHIAFAFGGAYFLARIAGISKLGAVACAGAFAGSSWHYLHIEIGHIVILPGTYIPWPVALYCYSVERRRVWPAALAGITIALMITEGGAHPALWSGMMLTVLASILALRRRSIFPLVALAAAGLFAGCFAAVKLLPGLEFTGIYARVESPYEVHELKYVIHELFSRAQIPTKSVPGLQWGFYEYGAYIGVWFGLLALVGIIFDFRRTWQWLILSLVLLAMTVGYFGPISPWYLVHKVPFYTSLREPWRWLAPTTLALSVLAGFGVDRILAIKARWAGLFTAGIVALALADGWFISTPYLHFVVEGIDPPMHVSTVFRQSTNPGLGAHMYMSARSNLGVLRCYEVPNMVPPVNASGFEEVAYRGEQYLLGPGTVKLVQWSPNALSFAVDTPSATAMVVNQNYNSNWRLVEGRGVVSSQNGLLSVLIPSGKQTLKLVYRNAAFWMGLSISTGAFIAMLLLCFWESRRPI
ncbi:MAG TPA: hypothetical protein VMU16_08975 [Candidatus Binataceae bacterium]|nr:hypothetical protein [Candidatus Binataceae bacterium]